MLCCFVFGVFFFQAEDGIRYLVRSRGLGDVYKRQRQQYVRAEYLAMGHAAVGDLDRAFDALERAYQARSAGLILSLIHI